MKKVTFLKTGLVYFSAYSFVSSINIEKSITHTIFLMLLPILIFAQNPGEPFKPETANGANYIHATGHRLLWNNPDSTLYNIVFFSEDSSLVAQLDPSVILHNGTASTVYDTIHLSAVEPLDWRKKYYWRVVEYYTSGEIEGPVWIFTTMSYPVCEEELLFENFEDNLNNWIVTNDGGTCVWEIHYPPYNYILPPNSTGGVLAADADKCGTGSTTLSTITLNTPLGNSFYSKLLEFDNDWQALDDEDSAFVEISTDWGITWEIVWSQNGDDLRNTHEEVYINEPGEIMIRFRTVQPGWDWWWAIDNVHMTQVCPLTQFYPPHNLKLTTFADTNRTVDLNWSRGQFSDIFIISRKLGLPTDTTPYTILENVNPLITSYTDTTVEADQIYTYRVWNMGGGTSNEATAYVYDVVPVKLIAFSGTLFDGTIKLNWSTATETNNAGFEIQKKSLGNLETGVNWKTIGFIPGHGTTAEPHHYSFIDETVNSGTYQYRLEQIDYDGSFEYSDIIEIDISVPEKFSLKQNYPNPFNPETKIKYSIPNAGIVKLVVYDVLGRAVSVLIDEIKKPGFYEISFDAADLSSGVYFYRLTAGDYVNTKKMILIR